MSGITRSTYQILSASLVLFLVVSLWTPWRGDRNRSLVAAVVLTGFAAIIVGGLVLYNSRNFGFSGLTPLSGLNMNGRTYRFIENLPDQYSEVRTVLIKYRDEALLKPGSSHGGTGYIFKPETRAELESITGMSSGELSDYMFKLNFLLIRDAPASLGSATASADGAGRA